MLVKTNNRDVIEQVRRDPGLREAIEHYREFRKALMRTLMTRDIEALDVLGKRQKPELNAVIVRIAQIYKEVTGRSPTTVGTDANKEVPKGHHPFSVFVIELFKCEGLDPPSIYAIRKATKTGRERLKSMYG